MKAGILTLHQADNYGAVLQAYALQQTLFDLGLDNEILTTDFPESSEDTGENLSGAAAVLAKRVREKRAERSGLFEQFRKEYLVCSKEYKKTDMARSEPVYDIFITGSDQVWNMSVLGANACYFLPFAEPGKRISYAASFGGEELPREMRAWCAEILGDFKYISVREEQAKEYICKLTGKEAVLCVDPVFLIDSAGWKKLTRNAKGKAYYLLYMLVYDEALSEQAKRTADKAGADLKVITGSFMPRFGFEAYSGISVTDWLGAFADCEAVFTNSFHGTAFALIFGKPLLAAGLKGHLNRRSGRIKELLLRAGMEDAYERTLYKAPEGAAMERLKVYTEASMNYLKKVTEYAGSI